MKRLAILTALAVAWPATALADNFKASLTGYQEVPSVSTLAEGSFDAKSAGDWLSVDYTLTFSGLQAPVQQAHIHFAQPAVNGPIIIWLCGTAALPGPAGTPTCPQSGTVSGTFTTANVLPSPSTQQLAAGEIGEMISAMIAGSAYVNVHTTASPGGEIRGQIKR
jgi:hypothetical protein